ncbi:MAG: hypothetical protein AMXMBFR56_35370 [Polyangiaceae bacterium]
MYDSEEGMLQRAAIVLLLASGLCATPTPARACGPGGATGASVAPRQGAVVPRNIPAIHAFPGWSYGTPCTAGTVTLSQAPSTPIALTPSATEPNVYLLAGPLVAGASYAVENPSTCTWNVPSPVSFTAGDSRKLPLETGKLEIAASGFGYISWSSGSCSWGNQGPWVQLRLRPACDLVPFLPVTRFTTEVSGGAWATSGVGATVAVANEHLESRTVGMVWSSCSSTEVGPPPTTGKQQISVRAHIVGASIDPAPAELTFDFDCTQDAGSSSPPWPSPELVDVVGPCIADFDASTPPIDATDEAGENDASAAEASVDAGIGGAAGFGASAGAATDLEAGDPRELRPAGACSHDGHGSGSGLAPLALFVAAGLVAGRRRAPSSP